MNKEIKTIVKKTVKIAGVTCIALGGAALITSGAALKALTEGAKYLKDTVKKIIDEDTETDASVVAEAVETPAGDSVAEAVVLEEDNAEIEETV